jgi:hypothetical protein
MPHVSNGPRIIDSDGSLRALLDRIECFGDPLSYQTPVPTTRSAAATASELGALSDAEGWRSAIQGLMPQDRSLALAFVAGFLAPLVVALCVFATWPAVTVKGPQSAPESAMVAANRAATFAVSTLKERPPAAPAKAEITVPGNVVATIGRSVPFPVSIEQDLRGRGGSMIRISRLPEYAGLSAGEPQADGAWLIEPDAALNLRLTAYAFQSERQDVTIEVLDASHLPLSATHTVVAVVAAPSEPDSATVASSPALVAEPTLVVPRIQPAKLVIHAPAAPVSQKTYPAPVRQPERPAPRATAPAKQASVPTKAMPTPIAIKVARVEPKSAAVATKVAKVEAKPAATPKQQLPAASKVGLGPANTPVPAPVLAAQIPPPPLAKSLPWSNNWMKSTLGMGQDGP